MTTKVNEMIIDKMNEVLIGLLKDGRFPFGTGRVHIGYDVEIANDMTYLEIKVEDLPYDVAFRLFEFDHKIDVETHIDLHGDMEDETFTSDNPADVVAYMTDIICNYY